MRLFMSVSEAQYEPHADSGKPPISPDQVAQIEIESDLIQVTYDWLRLGDDGDNFAWHDTRTGFWIVAANVSVVDACMADGTHVETQGLVTAGLRFTDWTVAE